MSTPRRTLVAALLLVAGAACYDLDVTNPNDPDFGVALAEPDSAVALIGGAFNFWFHGSYDYVGPGQALSNASFQHTSPWASRGSETYSRIPRVAFVNDTANVDYEAMVAPWSRWYGALRAVADGLRALDAPQAQALAPERIASARAFGRFVQGLSLASVAVLYARGFVVDEGTDLQALPEPLGYRALMDEALERLEECARLSENAPWSLPEEWMTVALTGPELARAARSMKARYRAAVARTSAERAAVDWAAVVGDVDAGIAVDLVLDMDEGRGWSNDVLGYGTYSNWSQLGFFVYGMADQSGSYQLWDATPFPQVWGDLGKSHTVGGRPMLIVTPDLRFPRGSTVEEQRLEPGRYFRVNTAEEAGNTWARPDRGTWRWSWYKHTRGEDYWTGGSRQPEIRVSEMRLLKAEALYRTGNRAGAAALVNQTRVAAGLSPADAAGTNESCVPRLPDGSCGGLLEMLKWEKRMENTFRGPLGNLWYFDGRGWGDLWKGTFLHLPLPCTDAAPMGLACLDVGGSGGSDGAPRSVYLWTGEK